jgi:CheY-like chemotaxis protein
MGQLRESDGMPRMDGYEVARRLRQEPGMESTVVVALTGWGQEEDRRRSQEAGFDHHLVKPVEPIFLSEFLASIHQESVTREQ